ncbi:MAG TPA: hypothetical protein VN665_00795 [Candidatus Paceibacterota bacterium]|nr:hypothetical protein [Candidatus Paceibacterota bacterium]
MTIEAIIFYLLLLDSVTANFVAYFGRRWYVQHFRLISRLFPLAKGWTTYYLVLVLWIGWLTHTAGLL